MLTLSLIGIGCGDPGQLTRATVEAKLADPACLVEIVVVAAQA